MAVTLSDLITGAKFRSDLTGSDRVTDVEWASLANEAILRAWYLAASARPDFQVTSQDFTVSSGQSASFAVPSTLFVLVDVVANPDTGNEFSLGPFAWANRKAPGGWGPPIFQSQGAQRARLMGTTIYLEPATSAGGTYRLWFCPKPATLTQADFSVRAATAGDLMAGAYAASGGPGAGRTVTSTAPGAMLVVDGVPLGTGDLFLAKNMALASNNGIYSVANDASNGGAWSAIRYTGFDSNSEIKLNATIYVNEGATGGQAFYSVSAFPSGVDLGALTFLVTIPQPNVALDVVLEPFSELLKDSMAITAVNRDERNSSDWLRERAVLEAQIASYFGLTRNAGNGPIKTIDTDARGPAYWMGW